MARQIVKVDLKKQMKQYYLPPQGVASVVDVPRMNFIMVDGKGEPGGERFQQAIQVMYGMAYTLKFKVKKEEGKDYPVLPLEGLWWMKGGGFDPKRREDWE
ncbi:MAG TPA: hypothetical protein VFE91_06575 [Nitrososphaerales archaeon]|nr:hypothetical protein [Nitrososphaerales archaeon]